MGAGKESEDVLAAWARLPQDIETAIAGLTDCELDLRGGAQNWSVRETVHHLLEANLVAASIIIAGLGASGCIYDWSWLNPDRSWMQRMGYSTAQLGPAIDALRALCRYVSKIVTVSGGRTRQVRLLDAPGAELRPMTVEEVIREEVTHAHHHLHDIRETLEGAAGAARHRPLY